MIEDILQYTFVVVILLGVLALSFLLVASSIYILGMNDSNVPQCYEDVVLVGIGDFEHGRWDSYICGPAVDDFEGYYD